MDITLIIQFLLGLISLLAVLMFFLLNPFKKREEVILEEKHAEEAKTDTTLPALIRIIQNPDTSTDKLAAALEMILKYHSTIHPKIEALPHPDFDSYAEILFHIGRHKNINKKILLEFDTKLKKENPSYKKEIDDALMRGLNSRKA
jgi:hypothetical protein